MSNEGFKPEDIEDIVSRQSRGRKKTVRLTTAGIPRFVPPTPQSTAAKSEPLIQDETGLSTASDLIAQQEEELPPTASPCFNQADIDEFLARKPQKYRMNERDYKELGRNLILGVGDLAHGVVVTAVAGTGVIAEVVAESPTMRQSTYQYGYMGWGWYHDDGSFAG